MVTQQFDPHADVIVNAIEKVGAEALRVNSEDMLSRLLTWRSVEAESGSLTIADELGHCSSFPSGIVSGYYRKPLGVCPHGELLSVDAQRFSSSEGEAFLDSICYFRGLPWVSPPHLIRVAEAKIPQLQLATRLGLRIPRTVVTNDPKEARRFAEDIGCEVACKPLGSSRIEREGVRYDIFTRRLSARQVEEHLDSVRFAPTVLQEYVPKSTELRVTIIGPDCFSTEIDSQSVDCASVDWRRGDPFQIPHRAVALPKPLTRTLRRFVRHYGLLFGAFDLIRTPDGEYVFLENNPNGAWYWIELQTGQQMAASMARLLTGSDVVA